MNSSVQLQGFNVGSHAIIEITAETIALRFVEICSDFQIKFGFWVTPHLQAFCGYNYLQVSNVLRPGNQIDRDINPTQNTFFVPPGTRTGPAAPLPVFRPSEFVAHGVNLGMEWRY